MRSRERDRSLVMLAVALALASCVRPPADLARGPFDELTIAEARDPSNAGRRVRWGGSIVATKPEQNETCIEVVRMRLDYQARPQRTDDSDGRFLACAPGFYDPEVYAAGRRVTAIGALAAPSSGRIGEYDYAYPVVDAESIHLWPPRNYQVWAPYYYGPWPGPFWYGPPYWGPYWGPFWNVRHLHGPRCRGH